MTKIVLYKFTENFDLALALEPEHASKALDIAHTIIKSPEFLDTSMLTHMIPYPRIHFGSILFGEIKSNNCNVAQILFIVRVREIIQLISVR